MRWFSDNAVNFESVVPTARHLQFAKGYIDLGMVNEASDELKQIDWDDRINEEVLAMRVALYFAAKNKELFTFTALG